MIVYKYGSILLTYMKVLQQRSEGPKPWYNGILDWMSCC